MPVANVGTRGRGQPSCMDRVKTGFLMGAGVGLVSGVLLGGFRNLRIGLRGYELMTATFKSAAQGGFTFGTFLAIGTAIRC